MSACSSFFCLVGVVMFRRGQTSIMTSERFLSYWKLDVSKNGTMGCKITRTGVKTGKSTYASEYPWLGFLSSTSGSQSRLLREFKYTEARCEATGQDLQARNEPQKIRRCLVNFGWFHCCILGSLGHESKRQRRGVNWGEQKLGTFFYVVLIIQISAVLLCLRRLQEKLYRTKLKIPWVWKKCPFEGKIFMCCVDTSCFFSKSVGPWFAPFMVAEMRFEGLSSYQQDYVKHPTRPRWLAPILKLRISRSKSQTAFSTQIPDSKW